jgi:hypothetical protein
MKDRVPGECQKPEKPSSTPSHIICSSGEGGPENDECCGKNKGRLSSYPIANNTNDDLTYYGALEKSSRAAIIQG